MQQYAKDGPSASSEEPIAERPILWHRQADAEQTILERDHESVGARIREAETCLRARQRGSDGIAWVWDWREQTSAFLAKLERGLTQLPSRRTMRSAAATHRRHSGHRPPPEPPRPAHIRRAQPAAGAAQACLINSLETSAVEAQTITDFKRMKNTRVYTLNCTLNTRASSPCLSRFCLHVFRRLKSLNNQ